MLRLAAFAAFGLVFGSFLTVVIYRVPRGEGLGGRSKCPHCGRQVRAWENVPLLSFLALRGRCRGCGTRISFEYPVTEAATAALFVLAALVFEELAVAVLGAAFLAVMLALAVIDARWRIVPNRIVYPALATSLVAILVLDLVGTNLSVLRGLGAMAAYGGPLLAIAVAVPRGMGMGDVKLAGLIGLVAGSVGIANVVVAAAVGIIGGGLGGVVALAVFRVGRKQQMPFGPYLAAGGGVGLLAGPAIARAYLSITGIS
ncbi:MAG TPA: prepilin peptidase [Actinomycetota bacterium]|nr:prepilin peptidase [Actinomycetota bacterium]